MSIIKIYHHCKTSHVMCENRICLLGRVCLRYFNISEMNYLKLWSILNQVPLADRRSSAFLLVELCLCSSYSNATAERLFSQMKVIKTDWRNCLRERNLEDLLRIKISNVALREFSKGYADASLSVRANKKQRLLSKGKRKYSLENSSSCKEVLIANPG